MKLSKLNKLVKFDSRLPMKIKADKTIKVGDVIGFKAMLEWGCAIVTRIEQNGNNLRCYGNFYYFENEINLDKLKKCDSFGNLVIGEDSQKYMLRL